MVESANNFVFFSLFHKKTNHILSRKNAQFAYIHIAVACFVIDWSSCQDAPFRMCQHCIGRVLGGFAKILCGGPKFLL